MNTASRKILVTGGAGFIGSHIVEALREHYPNSFVVILDKMTYAAHESHVEHLTRTPFVDLVRGDINDFELVRRLMWGADLVVHAAAESHVDRSFGNPLLFAHSNVLGTGTMLEAAREANVPRFIHVSTDEVYGEVLAGDAHEETRFNPTNPYSASKAAAEMLVGGYRSSFRLPVITVRGNNVYGVRQFPEKLIPHCVMSMIAGEQIALHGDGSSVRHYLSAQDFANAIVLLSERGTLGETYNVGACVSYENREVARLICEQFGRSLEESVRFVTDRLFNDRRYAVSSDKLVSLGWMPKRQLAEDIPRIVEWYRENAGMLRERMEAESALQRNRPNDMSALPLRPIFTEALASGAVG